MKNIFIFILLAYSGLSNLLAQGANPYVTEVYKAGEELKYSLNYGFITGGYIKFTVNDTILQQVTTNEIKLQAVTTGFVDALFKVRDTYISYVNTESNQPVKSIRDIKEGKYRYYNEVTYDYNQVKEDSIVINSKKSGEVHVPSHVQDILSAFYFARKFNFNDSMKSGQILEYTTYFSDEVFPLRIKYMKTEVINTKYGKMECYLFHPVTEVGRVFETEDDMKIWVTRDNNRIPVKVKVNLKVGAFTCELEEFKGLKNPFSSIRN